MIRLVFFLVTVYFIFTVYRKYKNAQTGPKVIDAGKAKKFSKSSCPSPKTFIDYTEGRIKGKKKKAIDDHIAGCKNCQDAVKGVFGMSREKSQ
jgi:hypothetical protein